MIVFLVILCLVVALAATSTLAYRWRPSAIEAPVPEPATAEPEAVAAQRETLGPLGALAPTEKWNGGLLIDTTLGRAVVTTNTAGAKFSGGYYRDPDGRLVVDNV